MKRGISTIQLLLINLLPLSMTNEPKKPYAVPPPPAEFSKAIASRMGTALATLDLNEFRRITFDIWREGYLLGYNDRRIESLSPPDNDPQSPPSPELPIQPSDWHNGGLH